MNRPDASPLVVQLPCVVSSTATPDSHAVHSRSVRKETRPHPFRHTTEKLASMVPYRCRQI